MTSSTGEAIELTQTNGWPASSMEGTDHESDDGEFEVYHDALGEQNRKILAIVLTTLMYLQRI